MDLKVYFAGVCTHVQWTKSLPSFTNRVVLPNGSGKHVIDGHTVESHVAKLRIASKDIHSVAPPMSQEPLDEFVEWTLNGARLRIENPVITEVSRDEIFDSCIPHLSALTPEIDLPSKAAVDDADPQLTACIFELTGGNLASRATEKHAAYTVLETDTDGLPRVTITWLSTHETTEIVLHRGAEMTLSNLGETETSDDQYDFLLHYTLAAEMPLHPKVPLDRSSCVTNEEGYTWPPHFKSVGPGCSNSAYP